MLLNRVNMSLTYFGETLSQQVRKLRKSRRAFNISKETFDLNLVILDIIKDYVIKLEKLPKFNSHFKKKKVFNCMVLIIRT